MTDRESQLSAWWQSLTEQEQDAARGARGGLLSQAEVTSLTRAGVLVAAAHFPSSQPAGPEGFRMPSDVVLFIDRQTPRALTYRGHAAIVSALVQMLEERDVQVEWERPEERRGAAGAAEQVIVGIVTYGSIEAIKAAVAEFRRRFGDQPEVNVEGDGNGEDL